MDLQVRGLEGEAGAALEAYREAWPAEEVSPFKHGGEAVLPLFIAMRAGIRAFTTATHASKTAGRERERLGRVVQDYTTLALQTLDQ
jgi:aminoglycoside phosphotransferase family enzyme